MSDRYIEFIRSPLGQRLSSALGLPAPPPLRRQRGALVPQPLVERGALLAGAPSARLSAPIVKVLREMGAKLTIVPQHGGFAPIKQAAHALGVALHNEPTAGESAPAAYVFDASGLRDTGELRSVYDFFQPRLGRLPASARIVVLVDAPAQLDDPVAAACAAALRGFVRSLAKEIGRRGATVNLLEVGPHGADWLAGPLRFFLGDQAAFVTGQSLLIDEGPHGLKPPADFAAPLAGKVAVVTGAARGIGAAIAQTLAREGAQVVGIDRVSEEAALGQTLAPLNGRGLALDITVPDAGAQIAAELPDGIDILVHNAGITRDKTLRNMAPHLWDQVLSVNLAAILRSTDVLLQRRALHDGARIVCISSIGGIAGNAGQTNYGATKAGIIGYVAASAPLLAERGMAINAVAPGFIETQMTAMMPAVPREVGRRLSSLSQGGLPSDIAEAVQFFASPAAGGINGQLLRVCGQNFIGA